MKKYFAPLGVFVSGHVFLLVLLLFMPAVDTAGTQLASDTAAVASTFWGWTWVVGGVRLWVFLGAEALILFATAKAFLATRND